MKHYVLSVIMLAAYAISLQIQRMDHDKIFNVKNCEGIGGRIEGNNCTCSTLTSRPGETYYCKDLEELEEKCKYLLFWIIHVTLIALLFALLASLLPECVFSTSYIFWSIRFRLIIL